MTKKATLKRILLVAFIMTAIVTLFTITTAAKTDGYYTYSVSNGEATITDVDTSILGEETIPSTLGGYPVTSIGDYAFSDCYSLTSVTIPDSVTSIGDLAFTGCDRLTCVTLGSGLTEIGKQAFYCYRLVEIINKSNLFIHAGIGFSFPNAIEIHNGESKMVNKDDYLFYTYENINYLITYVGNDTDLVLPQNYNGQSYEIYKYAFYNFEDLTSVIIPENVSTIGDHAFHFCVRLKNINIPSSVTKIGDLAFAVCYDLTNVTFGENSQLTYLGSRAFSSDFSYNLIFNIYDNGEYLGTTENPYSYLIGPVNIDVTSFNVHEETILICESSFSSLSKLTNITMGNNVKNISIDTFSNCNNLIFNVYDNGKYLGNAENPYIYLVESVNDDIVSCTICDKTKFIGSRAFSGCAKLSNIAISNTVAVIGSSAFSGCLSLTNITIPNNVTSIESDTFNNCKNLTSVTIPYSITSIRDYAFYGCPRLVEVINHSSLNITKGLEDNGCVAQYALEVHNGNSKVINKNDYLFYTYNNVNYLISYIGNDRELILPVNYNGQNYEINKYSFYECNSLTSVTIGDGVTNIGNRAFYNCTALEKIYFNAAAMNDLDQSAVFLSAGQSDNGIEVVIGKNVTKIPAYLFFNASHLRSVEFEEGGVFCTSIGNSAFQYCHSLTSVVIPNKVTNIGSSAFSKCDGLTSVTIGDGVTSIGDYAFNFCTALEKIYFNATAMNDLSYDNYVFSYAGQNGNGIEVVIGKNVTKIPANLFNPYSPKYVSKITSVDFEEGSVCTNIGEEAFFYCKNLTCVTIPNSITSIAHSAFNECTGLTSVYITDVATWCNISFISSYANPLYYAENLYVNNELITDLIIPESVTNLGNYSFYNCINLTNVTIPNSLKDIGTSAFSGCSNLTSVTIHDGTTRIGSWAFYNCLSLTNITIPSSVTNVGSHAFRNCASLANITFLSPTTTIYQNKYTLPTTTTIYGFAGSAAEAYASSYSRTFVPFASDLATVFEFDATFETDAEKVGVYSSIATLNRTGNGGEVAFDFLYAEGASGALYIKDTDGAYQPLYGSDNNLLMLGEDATPIAVIYDNVNRLVRYYINNSLPRYGENKALAYDLAVSKDFCGMVAITDVLTTLDGVNFTNAYTINESGTAEIVALQENTEDSCSTRILAGVDMLYYGAVGFETELYIDNLAQNKTPEQSGVVYSSVIADTKTVLPSDYGFRYFATLTIEDVDLSDYSGLAVHLIIKPYTQVGTTKYYGSPAKVDITENEGEYLYAFDESYVG